MNNPIIVTDRSLTYYDSKLKGYIGSLYGCDMTVEWEPMENGKNYFKLKIALKNKHGAELFSKIVDFPLEQTIVSGSYDNETKSLILYFQDGTSTSIPVSELIDGFATKTELDKKADTGGIFTDSSVAYTKQVPEGSAPYATISKIGGKTYTDGSTLKDARITAVNSVGTNVVNLSVQYKWNCAVSIENDGLFIMTRTGSGGVAFFETSRFFLEAGKTYTLRNEGVNWQFVQLCNESGNVLVTMYGNKLFTPSESKYYHFKAYMNNASTAVGDICLIYLWINEGDVNLPYSQYKKHTLTIPDSVLSLKGYGQGDPNNEKRYNYIDLKSGKFVAIGFINSGVWQDYTSPQYTDINISGIIGVEEGGKITFENEYGYGVESELEFYLSTNNLIGARELVGDLKGTADVAKYYEENGNISSKTIAETFDAILNAGSPIKITTESLGALAQTQVISNISVSILANPPVNKGDVILDRYLYGDAAYLCFWLVTDVQGGESDGIMTLQGAGNIYVGGGSASVADRATSDGNGNNIVSTYETKAQVKAITDEIKSTASTAYERATLAINTAQDSLNRVNRGVQSISADYTSGAGSIGTFYLRVNFVGGGAEAYNITEAMRGLINDVLTYDR